MNRIIFSLLEEKFFIKIRKFQKIQNVERVEIFLFNTTKNFSNFDLKKKTIF